jgi:hypothetical protein
MMPRAASRPRNKHPQFGSTTHSARHHTTKIIIAVLQYLS